MGDILSAISVFLVFLTFLFNSIEKEITEIIGLRKPEIAQIERRKQFNNELLKLLYLKALPISIIYSVTFYSLLPKVVNILMTSNFSLWQFDALKTIFVFIEIGLLGLTIFAIIKTIHLVEKLRE